MVKLAHFSIVKGKWGIMEYEKPFLFIDTNFNLDEALMLKMAFNSFNFEVLGLSTSPGIMSTSKASENIVGLSVAEDLYLSVAKGEDISDSHNDKDIFKTTKDYPEEIPAYENILDKAEDCGKLDIVTTGPLTNLAKALREEPEIEDFISHIFILGGSLGGEIEENFKKDPEAIDLILNTGIDIFIIPEEVSKGLSLSDEMIENLSGINQNLDKILDEYKNVDEDKRILEAPLLLYLTQAPEAFIFEESGFKVDTKEEKGALLRVSSRKKNYMANKVNEDAFYDFVVGSLTWK